MLYVFRIVLLYCFCCFSVAFVNAQENRKITGDFTQIKFDQFVREIEAKTSYHFYFNREELDSFTVNVSVTDASLRDVLNQVLKGSSFKFAIDSSNNVFVSKKALIQTSLPSGFFDHRKPGDTSDAANL